MKNIFSILWRLAALAAAIFVCTFAVRWSSGYYDAAPLVGLVAPDGQLSYVDASVLASRLRGEGYRFIKIGAPLDAVQGTDLLIGLDPEVIIVCCDVPFTDEEVAARAREKDITLLFVGAEPRQSILDSYEKAWALCNDAAHGGQLLGREAALGFREGGIVDANENLLLDCAALLPQDYPSAGVVGREVIAEAEHYGVYSDLKTTLTSPTAALAASLDEAWHGEGWQPSAAETVEDAENEEDLGYVPSSPVPELVFCAGSRAAQLIREKADEMGWLEDGSPTRIAVLAESESQAQALRESGVGDYIAYYDRDAATRILTAFAENVLHQRYVAQDCEVQPDQDKKFIFAYKLWSEPEDAS